MNNLNEAFKKAYDITMKLEGGYSNHSSDRGGETYKGISRVFHKNWLGWVIVDSYTNKQNLQKDINLQKEVKSFYKKNYWDKVNLDIISNYLPECSLELFDIAVNMGSNKAGNILQRALNILNRNEKLYSDLETDGIVGNKTINSIDKYISYVREHEPEALLLKLISLLKAKHYIDIVEANKTQEVFIRGWLKRIKI